MNGTRPLTVGGEFDGIGLLALGLHLAGLQHAWLCEVDPWRRSMLELRFPGVPVFDDVRAVGAASARPVDVIAGGFPCKGVSPAGKQNGFEHPETVLWREMRRTISELRPRYVLIENVANLLALHGGALWGEVLGDLASLGFDVVWDSLPAASVGAPHRRDRVFAVAWHPDRASADALAATGQPRGATRERPGQVVADADGPHERRDGGELGEQGGRPDARGDGEALADAEGAGLERPGLRRRTGEHAGKGYGVAVEWGDFQPAIDRWEREHGAAPEPLLRGVDDRRARGLVKSRLSALGDGVQVQVGYLAGRHIVDLERERVAA